MPGSYPDIEDFTQIVSDPDARYTVRDYLRWRFDEMVELIRGKVFRMIPAPSTFHQIISANLSREFLSFFKGKQCKVFTAPTDVYLPVTDDEGRPNTVVQPDILIICDRSTLKENGIHGTPDLIAEIISPHTSRKDLQLKYEVYRDSKVKEYWIIYPKDQILHIYTLNEKNEYALNGMYNHEDIINPVLFPTLKIDLSEVFESSD